MKIQYCKPETEVDYLELENDFLASTEQRSTQTTIVDDMDAAENIYW